MDQRRWLVFILLPLVWTASWSQVDSARPLETRMLSQKSAWPWYSLLPPVGQPLLSGPSLPNLLNITIPFPPAPPPSPPPFSSPKIALPPFTAPKFPSLPRISQPPLYFPPFSQTKPTLPSIPPTSLPKPTLPSIPPISLPKPTLPSIPPTSLPGNIPKWGLSLPPFPQPSFPKFPAWGPSSWSTTSPPPATPSFPWTNPTPPVPSGPSSPWNTPSPPPMTLPTFPNVSNIPNIPKIPTIPTIPSIPTVPTDPLIPTIPDVPTIPSLPWNTPSPPPSFPWLSSPPPFTLPTVPGLNPAPAIPKNLIGSTLPPFGLPPGGPLLPTGIKFTFSNFTNSWLPSTGVKVSWESEISIDLSLVLVDTIIKPVTLIIQQFQDFNSAGPGSWGWKNGLTGSKLSANVGATCTTLGENGLPAKGLIVVRTPIDNTVDTAVTWFTVLFHGWSQETPFNATLDHTPGTFGGFVTNVTAPNLKSYCLHPGSLNKVAAKQGQYVLG